MVSDCLCVGYIVTDTWEAFNNSCCYCYFVVTGSGGKEGSKLVYVNQLLNVKHLAVDTSFNSQWFSRLGILIFMFKLRKKRCERINTLGKVTQVVTAIT